MGQRKTGTPDCSNRSRSSWRIRWVRFWRFSCMISLSVSASITITSTTSVATMAAAAAAMLYPPILLIKMSMWVCQAHPSTGLR